MDRVSTTSWLSVDRGDASIIGKSTGQRRYSQEAHGWRDIRTDTLPGHRLGPSLTASRVSATVETAFRDGRITVSVIRLVRAVFIVDCSGVVTG